MTQSTSSGTRPPPGPLAGCFGPLQRHLWKFAAWALVAQALSVASAPSPVPKEWTIMVYLNGDNDLEPWALRNFLQMSKVGSSDKVNIVVQFDRIPGNEGASPDYDDWTQTLRFFVARDMKPMSNQALIDLGELDMGDPKTLADFITWCRKQFPANKYMLVIWDHGQGWRIRETVRNAPALTQKMARLSTSPPFLDAPLKVRTQHQFASYFATFRTLAPSPVDAILKAAVAPAEIPFTQAVGGAVRYVSTDETSGNHLYNAAIQDVLQAAFQTNQLDVIGFDACLMSMVETAYAMRKSCQVMVASEELEPGTGWNYTTWLTALEAKPEMTAEELGKVLVDSYQKEYAGVMENTTLSATRLSQIDPLATNISRFADQAVRVLPANWQAIKQARYQCLNYAQGYHLNGIDLTYFVAQAAGRVGDQEFRSAGTALTNQLQKTIVANYAGRYRQQGFGSAGLAIYFPHTRSAFDADPDKQGYQVDNTVYPVEFVRSQRWVEFLQAYLTYAND